MPKFDWRKFLEKYSRELLADEHIEYEQPPEVVESGWMGFRHRRPSE